MKILPMNSLPFIHKNRYVLNKIFELPHLRQTFNRFVEQISTFSTLWFKIKTYLFHLYFPQITHLQVSIFNCKLIVMRTLSVDHIIIENLKIDGSLNKYLLICYRNCTVKCSFSKLKQRTNCLKTLHVGLLNFNKYPKNERLILQVYSVLFECDFEIN